MRTILINAFIGVVVLAGIRGQTLNRNFDANALQIVGVADPNMTYDQVMAGYLGLDSMEKEAFKLQIGYMDDSNYIVAMNKQTKTMHRISCRYVNENCVFVLRDSAIKNGGVPCGSCNP